MSSRNGSRTAGTRAAVSALYPALLLLALGAPAETVRTVNDVDIDSTVFDAYVLSRTQRPTAQLTAEERETLLSELADLYLLSTQESAATIRNEPRVIAQIELQTRGLVAQQVAARYIESIEVTDEEVQAEYAEQADLAPPLQYKARHILVESQGAAAAIIEELDAGGDFVELATEKSTGPTGPSGGDLGWFLPEQMVPEFSQAVVAMEDGAYTAQPVQTQYGWHVILREDSRDAEAPPLENVRDTIEQAIRQEKFQTYLQSIRDDAAN